MSQFANPVFVHSQNKNGGFTLVEMAVVVVIIGMLMGLGMKAANFVLENMSYSATKKKQEAIKDALINYLGKNGSLPCPDVFAGTGTATANQIDFPTGLPDGVQDRVGNTPTGACINVYGLIPYDDLGLNKDFAMDGWSNFFSYRVWSNPATGDDWTVKLPASASDQVVIDDTKIGGINLSLVDPQSTPTTQTATNKWVVAIVSHGMNGFGAFNAKGVQNSSAGAYTDATLNLGELNNIYDQANPTPGISGVKPIVSFSIASNKGFDDLVTTMSADEFITPLKLQHVLTATSLARDDIFQIELAISTQLAQTYQANTTSSNTPCVQSVTPVSVWTGLINYPVAPSANTSVAVSITNANPLTVQYTTPPASYGFVPRTIFQKVDPWGFPYYTFSTSTAYSINVWSSGRDGDFSTGSDNIAGLQPSVTGLIGRYPTSLTNNVYCPPPP